ncbi:hypothetical protein AMTRI_Chr04g243570 [Amborella trichopoda]|uniref:AAA+ ATPase domain-containing protein n=1 Tax=Amborella trichopoda TaxID=13333 RepID=W1PT12_AMBTC|nr:AAA-ATPase At4g30250 [Amborella trichopoda]ERN11158.1 hypothetical protein AMTR_s00024p00191310 [Amborella trichopoda]|eukprot:XP_020526008.1 AAA-ATPase At4g30250 [Amborella trichopoda]
MEILAQIWSFLGLLTVLQNVLPSQILTLILSWYESLQDLISPYSYFEIPEFNGYCSVEPNELYRQIQLYLQSLGTCLNSRRVTATRAKNSRQISFMVAPNQSFDDTWNGRKFLWTHHVETVQESLEERRSFGLKISKRDREFGLNRYFERIAKIAEEFENSSRDRRLFTNNGHGGFESGWASVPFRHPATFETLAFDPKLKAEITSDLTAFSKARDFYSRVGRSWKRGYLLYGPPGTGKSSLIAAMANFLHYDVYDLELTKVSDNSELRALLIQTTNKSIIVIEDIDCSLDFSDRNLNFRRRKLPENRKHCQNGPENPGQVTLSGLLNFTDGLWSCCGEERIIVFTTNYKDAIDVALIRSGRMDMHIRLGPAGFDAFKTLACNYLGLRDHRLFEIIEREISEGGRLTPAEISEIMVRFKGDVDNALREVVTALKESVMEFVDEKTDSFQGVVGSPLKGFGMAGKGKKGGLTWQEKVRCLVRVKSLMRSSSSSSSKRGI